MNKYEMTAECAFVGPIETVGQNGFQKRTVVLVEDKDGKFPKFLAWELKKDRVNLVNAKDVGKKFTVSGYPESRAWTDKNGVKRFFTSLTAINITRYEKDDATPAPAEVDGDEVVNYEDADDMPF